jgi:hypothetical protein
MAWLAMDVISVSVMMDAMAKEFLVMMVSCSSREVSRPVDPHDQNAS